MTANLNFLENCLRILSRGDSGQLRTEIEKNLFSDISERFFLKFQSVSGSVKLALNQQYINNTQNQTHF